VRIKNKVKFSSQFTVRYETMKMNTVVELLMFFCIVGGGCAAPDVYAQDSANASDI
jgi:hypothetical protein